MADGESCAPRLFADDAAVARVGEGLLARTLPRAEWTHEAHLAATVHILRHRLDILPERDFPAIIRSYNVSVGGVNDNTQGYHETLTQFYVATVRAFVAGRPASEPTVDIVNALLVSPQGDRGYPLRCYSRDRLFSVAARRTHIAPDLVS